MSRSDSKNLHAVSYNFLTVWGANIIILSSGWHWYSPKSQWVAMEVWPIILPAFYSGKVIQHHSRIVTHEVAENMLNYGNTLAIAYNI